MGKTLSIRYDDTRPRSYPHHRERVPLLVVQVLLHVEEGVEEDVAHLAPLQVPQRDVTWGGGEERRR